MNIDFLTENASLIITVIAVGVIFLEWLLLVIGKQVERNKEGWVSVLSAGLAFGPIFLITRLFFLGLMFGLYEFRIFELGFEWYYWLIAWVIYDFLFWLIHYLGHKVRFFWCLHGVHHSAKEMKLSVGFRGSLFDFLYVPHNVLWLPLLGFHPGMVIIVDTFAKLYGILVHINEKWVPNKKGRWIEKFWITPSAHRVHHSTNHLYLDRNFGEAFSIWDHLFSTYQPEIPEEKPVYGVLKDIDSENLWDTQSYEFKALWRDIRSAEKFSDKLKYLLKPPGWNHRDGGVLAEDLRKEALTKLKT